MSTHVAPRKAQMLLDALGIEKEPVPVRRVAASLNLQIVKEELGEVAGLLVRDRDQQRAYICVNASDAIVRRRFTIAHEIGHYVLNHQASDVVIMDAGYSFNYRDARSSQGSDPIERAANAFAAALLMPEDFIRRALAEQGISKPHDRHIDNLAARFKVSSLAMDFRLRNLPL